MAKKEEKIELPEILPLIPIKDMVIYPYMNIPIIIGRDFSVRGVEESLTKDRFIFLVTQKDPSQETPSPEEIYSIGTIALIMRMLKLSDGRVQILVQGISKAEILEFISQTPVYVVKVKHLQEQVMKDLSPELESLLNRVREKIGQILPLKNLPIEISTITNNINDPGRLADLVASNLRLKLEEMQQVFEMLDPIARLKKIDEYLARELEVSTMQVKIQSQATEGIDRSQREFFLREQMKVIQAELGDLDERVEEITELREKIEKAGMPREAFKEASRQLKRLEQMHPDAAEATVTRTYLDWLVELPWKITTTDNLDLKKVKEVLDSDHYDIDQVKERIIEYLAVRKLKKRMKGPILCFVGPPGVGKTSLGRSIAKALGRKFVRISLGGIRDEAEIRGHRRTYVGALPGRIIQGIKEAGSTNPVFMMDEIDKLGADFRGDPSAALLEVLDPEQNFSFIDHYLHLPYNLSEVMFLLTANVLDTIPSTLRDRMEILTLPGYTSEEKLQIALQYLLPRQLEANGLSQEKLDFYSSAIMDIITSFTKEAGLRNLEREIASVCRKIARKIAEGQKTRFKITSQNLPTYLGPPRFLPEEEQSSDEIGVATGLAWTAEGGEILHVEVTTMPGEGKLLLTGHLGDVMKESAQAALTYARARTKELRIDENFYEKLDIHIHIPAGAIPKDGPSAGVTIATALTSALTKIPVRRDVAMTGEVTLRGRILPIAGLKEKALAALRYGIKDVLIPARNKKDLEEIPSYVKKKLNFTLLKNMDEIINIALVKS